MSQQQTFVDIVPTRLYRTKELEHLIGTATLRQLRKAGLCAVGPWYLGESVLEIFRCAWHNKSCQRVPGKGEKIERDTTKREVAKGVVQRRRVQPVSKHKRADDLGSQLQDFKREISQETV